jgi:hypothetical protein
MCGFSPASATRWRMIPSAMGERQMLPQQTNRMRTGVAACDEGGCDGDGCDARMMVAG